MLSKLQDHNVQCQQISVGHGQEEIIDVALATAVRTDTWLVIENLQLASRHWLEQLYNRLSRLQLQAGRYYFEGRMEKRCHQQPTPYLFTTITKPTNELSF